MRTKGFCWALLRCGEIKLIAEKRVYAISALWRISRERSGAEQNPLVYNLVSPYRMSLASFSFSAVKTELRSPLSRDTYKNIHPYIDPWPGCQILNTARVSMTPKRASVAFNFASLVSKHVINVM